MKELLEKNNKKIAIGMFVILCLFHLPLMIKNILTADVLLNNYFYNGYSWEISLGRFGTFIVGLLKSYLSFPHIDLIFSYIFLTLSFILLLKLFEIKDKSKIITSMLLFIVSPVVSATLLFHFWNVVYFIAFFLGVSSIYIFYKWDHKIGKYLVPIIFITGALSFYQAYLSMIVTTFVLYNVHLILKQKIDYKESLKYIGCLFIGVLSYFILMKLSQIVLHIDMASYSNANSIGISTILSIPSKIIDSYKLFYEFYFANSIMKNTYFYNHLLNILLWILFITTISISIYKSKINTKEKVLLGVLILLLPVFLNSVIFVISDSKLQLLMSASYLIVPIFFLSQTNDKYIKIGTYIVLAILLRNYFIQDQASYYSLENTFNEYYTIINTAVTSHINEPNKKYVVLGNVDYKKNTIIKNIHDRNYGYITDDGIFWQEYNLRGMGFKRFVSEYLGLTVEYVDEDTYNKIIKEDTSTEVIYEIDDTVVINLENYNK